MSTFLLKLLELSLQAGALTLGILLVRLVLKKFPAKYLCLLWAIVAVRLVVPFSIEAGFAWAPNYKTLWFGEEQHNIGDTYAVLIEKTIIDSKGNVIESYRADSSDHIDYFLNDPDTEKIPIESIGTSSDVYAELIEHTITRSESGNGFEASVSPTPVPEGVANAAFRLDWWGIPGSVTPVLFGLWLLGIAILLGYGAVSCLRVKRQVKNAIPYEDNIWLCDGLQTPFLYGWRKPQIYLPTNLEEKQMHYVILHEKAHIARGDNYSKLAGYLLLTVYWFNPLIWLAYATFCKDVERACDEKVIDDLDVTDRKDYAEALLECSIDRRFSISNPLAFGEMDVKKRITGVLKYKKPGKVFVLVALLLCMAAVAGCFFVKKEDGENTYRPEVTPTHPPRGDGPHTPTPLPPSDLELLGKITSETVLAVPMGQTVEADLNGDGKNEVITMGYDRYENGKSLKEASGVSTFRRACFYLTIGSLEYKYNHFINLYWNDNPGFTTYYIFDIDTTDNYKEIGVYFDGPSGNPCTALYRYVFGELWFVGMFESATLESDYGRNSAEYENVPYEEMVKNVDRENFVISVPGDGTILCKESTCVLETTEIVREYKLSNAGTGNAASLQEVIRDRYEFTTWQEDRGTLYVKAAKDFCAYRAPVDMSANVRKDALTTKIKEGTRIAFVAYHPDNEWTAGWIQLAYGENLENVAWVYKGVDPRGKSMIYLPTTTESNPTVLFENLGNIG